MELVLRGQGGRVSRISFGQLSGIGGTIDATKTVVVTDRLIRRIYGQAFPACPAIEVERGEAAKSLASLEALYGSFLENSLGRDGLVLAIGGGAISDLAGFAASTWLRGVDFGFAPTTLLAMVDASIGGKNGLDFRGVKNLVGSFAQPRFVTIDVGLLATLPDVEFASGMAEVVKHAVLAGGDYFDLVERSSARSARPHPEAPLRPSDETLERIVAGSVELKAGVVERDERESGERRKLNLGHSVGHGIEATAGLPHGHSIAAGLGAACRLALRIGRLCSGDCERILRLIEAQKLPSTIAAAARLAAIPDGPEFRKAVGAAVLADKKRLGSDILMALPAAIGSVVVEPVPLADLQAFIMEAP